MGISMKEERIYIPAQKYLTNNFVRYNTLKQGRPENGETGKYGTRLDKPEILRQLPKVGEQIVLRETVISSAFNVTGRICSHMDSNMLYETYISNAMGEPQIFRVTNYTEGIENALSRTNKMYVEFKLGALNYCSMASTFFMAHLITSGYLNWTTAEEYYAKKKEQREKQKRKEEMRETGP